MDWKFALVLVFSLFVAVFTIQNSDSVDISFLGFEFTQVSQALVILISAASGALIALLFGAIRWVKDKSRMAAAKRTIAALETQVKLIQDKLDKEIGKNLPQTTPPQDQSKGTGKETAPKPATSDKGEQQKPLEQEEPKDDAQAETPAPKKKWWQI